MPKNQRDTFFFDNSVSSQFLAPIPKKAKTPFVESNKFHAKSGPQGDDMSFYHEVILSKDCYILSLPHEILTGGILLFLQPKDMGKFGCCSKYSADVCEEGCLWRSMFRTRYSMSDLSPNSIKEWKLAYKLTTTKISNRLRCFHTGKNFFEDVLGVGIDFSFNPKTRQVDYINMGQDLLSETAFQRSGIREDVFGNQFKLFLPLYFSAEHFQRALPGIRKTIVTLCPGRRVTQFEPLMVLDVLPKIMNTFIVLLADEGISASGRSFRGFTRVHRLFLALAHEHPSIKKEALRRLQLFAEKEENRMKSSCPSLGNILPLLSIVDQKDFDWSGLCTSYLDESFDRSVLWVLRKHPQLQRTHVEDTDERLVLTREAMTINMRLLMFHVYFQKACCRKSSTYRARLYDCFFGQPDPEGVERLVEDPTSNLNCYAPLSYSRFQRNVQFILSVNTWQSYFDFIGVPYPLTRYGMARMLRNAVENSHRKGYHRPGMDFSRIHSSGTSRILAKGQQYSTSSELRRVMFTDRWGFRGDNAVYLDATCLLYRGKTIVHTVDYKNIGGPADSDSVWHSGDMMHHNGGTHEIHLDLEALGTDISSCVFVISAWNGATLSDIVSPSISFIDMDADSVEAEPLCTYNLDAHDKVSHLTSVVMCKLYRARNGKGWHILAIGDAHYGCADNYRPIYSAVQKYL